MDTTARLDLPLLVAGQAQKEIFHNEALQRIDACVAACVVERSSATPPVSPSVGECHLVAAGASGAWAGHVAALACFGEGGWRFVAAREGLRVWVASEGVDATFRAGAWDYGIVRGSSVRIDGTKVVGGQQPAIADAAGGSVVDVQSRSVIGQLLAALRAHGLIAS